MKKQAIFTLVLTLTLLATAGQTVGLSTPLDGASARQRANAAASAGTTYYVDQKHDQADDSNPGTEELPWLTIQHAADEAVAGDTVYVKEGDYAERVTIHNSGTESSRIVFQSYPRRVATVLLGFRVMADYTCIEGFNITNPTISNPADDEQGILNHGSYLEVVDNYFYDVKSVGVYDWLSSNPSHTYIAHNEFYRCQYGVKVGDNALVEYNEVERLYDWGNGDCDYARFFGEDIKFRYNHFHGTVEEEIGGAHVDCWQTFCVGGAGSSHHVTIENNICATCHQGFMIACGSGGTISDIIIRNNIIRDGWVWGISAHDDTVQDISVYNNTFYNISGYGIGIRGGATGVAKNNILYNAASGSYNLFLGDGFSETGSNLLYFSDKTIDPAQFPNDIVNEDPQFVDAANRDLHLQAGSPAIDAGENLSVTGFDYDKDGVARPQGSAWDIGAYEYVPTGPALALHGAPGDRTIYLDWTVENLTLPVTATWHIDYYTQTVTAPFTATEPLSTTRTYTLTGLTNYQWYTVTLHALDGATSILSDTVRVMPTDKFVYLPLVLREK